jgi:beta-xylosidase
MLKTRDLRVRDPFVLPVTAQMKYYLFGSSGQDRPDAKKGFDYYTGSDLEQWEGPFPAFRRPADFWSDRDFWAPEVHAWQGRYHMFASFKAEGRCRGTQILRSEAPGGPYAPFSFGPATPSDWECLDGTLHVDGSGKPWMVFCREWLQVKDGEMWALPLKEDLSGAAGKPGFLFRASDAPWAPRKADGIYVTDGPFLHPLENGALGMLWSSFGATGYALALARSDHGVLGPWRQDAQPLFSQDGGHGMLFRDFGGRLMLAMHSPNESPRERAKFVAVSEKNGELILTM